MFWEYWDSYKPLNKGYLFSGQNVGEPYSTRSLQLVLNAAKQKAGILKQLISLLYTKGWNVYAKAPFGGPQTVVEYLGRYTHKVAISNHRIESINDETGTVTFGYKDYADEGKQKPITLTIPEFIRRFTQHILPPRFTKIRTYGYLANRNRQRRINEVLQK